jgi:lactoylglutathione lyase
MNREDFPAPREGVIITHFLVVRDWYRDVFGAKVVRERDPVMLKFHNSWLILNVGGAPTDDKPHVILEPPSDPSRTSAFLNLRVADVQQVYEEWSARGAEFLTPRSTGERRSAAISAIPTATSSRSDSPPAF